MEPLSEISDLLEDYTFDHNVRFHVTFLVCLVLVKLCLALQRCKFRKKNFGTVMTTVITICCLAFAGPLMVGQLVDVYINIKYRLNLDKFNGTETVGFPYWAPLYTIALVATLAAIIASCMEMHELEQEVVKHVQSIRAEGIDMPLYEPQHEKTKVFVRPAKSQISLGIRPV